ncbi:hypothetical protein [Chroococcidiopsis sp.]|uniref:hypothetical protein n=1 Tax=Chroococcidiopsis sp. TaxID=3088168 RepID=UPI000B6B5857|nr:hypothetical protein B7486_46335 [cyanobacterium TDX16]
MMESKLLLSLVQKGERIMEPWIDLSSLSNSELTALEQQILQEQSRRVMNDPELIVVEPDASEESHREAIAKLLQRKK